MDVSKLSRTDAIKLAIEAIVNAPVLKSGVPFTLDGLPNDATGYIAEKFSPGFGKRFMAGEDIDPCVLLSATLGFSCRIHGINDESPELDRKARVVNYLLLELEKAEHNEKEETNED